MVCTSTTSDFSPVISIAIIHSDNVGLADGI